MGYRFIDESKWIEDIRAGDKAAFKNAFEYFYSTLCAYTNNLAMDPDMAEDIVQEIFIALWNNRGKLRITTSLKSYLYKACYHKYIDIYRKKKRLHKKLEELKYMEVRNFAEEDLSTKNHKIENLNRAIQNLPPKCKEIFLLSKFEGLKYAEIAIKLDISIKTVENQIGFAYSKLRKALKQ